MANACSFFLASSVRCPRAQILSRRSQGAPLVSPNCHPHSPPPNSLEAVGLQWFKWFKWQVVPYTMNCDSPCNILLNPCTSNLPTKINQLPRARPPGHQPPPPFSHGPTKRFCGSGPPGMKLPTGQATGSEVIPVHSQAFHQYASPKKLPCEWLPLCCIKMGVEWLHMSLTWRERERESSMQNMPFL